MNLVFDDDSAFLYKNTKRTALIMRPVRLSM